MHRAWRTMRKQSQNSFRSKTRQLEMRRQVASQSPHSREDTTKSLIKVGEKQVVFKGISHVEQGFIQVNSLRVDALNSRVDKRTTDGFVLKDQI